VQRPRQVLDLTAAVGILDKIGAMVDRIQEERHRNALSRAEVTRIVTAMSEIVREHVSDSVTLARIQAGWMTIRG
jgi:hypothetical protein